MYLTSSQRLLRPERIAAIISTLDQARELVLSQSVRGSLQWLDHLEPQFKPGDDAFKYGNDNRRNINRRTCPRQMRTATASFAKICSWIHVCGEGELSLGFLGSFSNFCLYFTHAQSQVLQLRALPSSLIDIRSIVMLCYPASEVITPSSLASIPPDEIATRKGLRISALRANRILWSHCRFRTD